MSDVEREESASMKDVKVSFCVCLPLGRLGIRISQIVAYDHRSKGTHKNLETVKGLSVCSVAPESPAVGKIFGGDFLTHLNGEDILNMNCQDFVIKTARMSVSRHFILLRKCGRVWKTLPEWGEKYDVFRNRASNQLHFRGFLGVTLSQKAKPPFSLFVQKVNESSQMFDSIKVGDVFTHLNGHCLYGVEPEEFRQILIQSHKEITGDLCLTVISLSSDENFDEVGNKIAKPQRNPRSQKATNESRPELLSKETSSKRRKIDDANVIDLTRLHEEATSTVSRDSPKKENSADTTAAKRVEREPDGKNSSRKVRKAEAATVVSKGDESPIKKRKLDLENTSQLKDHGTSNRIDNVGNNKSNQSNAELPSTQKKNESSNNTLGSSTLSSTTPKTPQGNASSTTHNRSPKRKRSPTRKVKFPKPSKLGLLLIKNKRFRGFIVNGVLPKSPLIGKVFEGEVITHIDGRSLGGLKILDVANMIKKQKINSEIEFTLATCATSKARRSNSPSSTKKSENSRDTSAQKRKEATKNISTPQLVEKRGSSLIKLVNGKDPNQNDQTVHKTPAAAKKNTISNASTKKISESCSGKSNNPLNTVIGKSSVKEGVDAGGKESISNTEKTPLTSKKCEPINASEKKILEDLESCIMGSDNTENKKTGGSSTREGNDPKQKEPIVRKTSPVERGSKSYNAPGERIPQSSSTDSNSAHQKKNISVGSLSQEANPDQKEPMVVIEKTTPITEQSTPAVTLAKKTLDSIKPSADAKNAKHGVVLSPGNSESKQKQNPTQGTVVESARKNDLAEPKVSNKAQEEVRKVTSQTNREQDADTTIDHPSSTTSVTQNSKNQFPMHQLPSSLLPIPIAPQPPHQNTYLPYTMYQNTPLLSPQYSNTNIPRQQYPQAQPNMPLPTQKYHQTQLPSNLYPTPQLPSSLYRSSIPSQQSVGFYDQTSLYSQVMMNQQLQTQMTQFDNMNHSVLSMQGSDVSHSISSFPNINQTTQSQTNQTNLAPAHQKVADKSTSPSLKKRGVLNKCSQTFNIEKSDSKAQILQSDHPPGKNDVRSPIIISGNNRPDNVQSTLKKIRHKLGEEREVAISLTDCSLGIAIRAARDLCGILILSVMPSSRMLGKLFPGDLITHFNQTPLDDHSSSEFLLMFQNYKSPKKITVRRVLDIDLKEYITTGLNDESRGSFKANGHGKPLEITLRPGLIEFECKYIRDKMIVLNIDSETERITGIQRGDMVERFDGHYMSSVGSSLKQILVTTMQKERTIMIRKSFENQDKNNAKKMSRPATPPFHGSIQPKKKFNSIIPSQVSDDYSPQSVVLQPLSSVDMSQKDLDALPITFAYIVGNKASESAADVLNQQHAGGKLLN